MFRALLLILVLFSSLAFSQKKQDLKAYKFFEFGKISNNLLKEKLENFRVEILKSSNAQGYIINYGKAAEIANLEKQIRRSSPRNCGYDGAYCGRIVFLKSNITKKKNTQFWIVPEGAQPPTP